MGRVSSPPEVRPRERDQLGGRDGARALTPGEKKAAALARRMEEGEPKIGFAPMEGELQATLDWLRRADEIERAWWRKFFTEEKE